MLTDAQQERYARHLILDDFGGEGQEHLLAAAVRVRGKGAAALWAARYLAASGVGALCIDVAEWRAELHALGPWLRFVDDAPVQVEPREGTSPSESAMNGAAAAVDVVRGLRA